MLFRLSEVAEAAAQGWRVFVAEGEKDVLALVQHGFTATCNSGGAVSEPKPGQPSKWLDDYTAALRGASVVTSPTPGGLNQRHPDFAAFAVRIGRALGREAECVAALQQAEVDKSAFCLENDPIAAALLACLRASGSFTGTAAELVPKLCDREAGPPRWCWPGLPLVRLQAALRLRPRRALSSAEAAPRMRTAS